MSVTIDTLRIARAWEREHDRRPEVVYVSEARLRAIAGEHLPPIGQDEIDRTVALLRAGEDNPRIGGFPLDIDDRLEFADVVPAELPRALYTTGSDGARIVGPEREALAVAEAIDDPRIQIAFTDTVEMGILVPTSIMLATVGVDHPVLLLPSSTRDAWEANPGPIPEYTGPLPDPTRAGVARRFELVKPKAPQGKRCSSVDGCTHRAGYLDAGDRPWCACHYDDDLAAECQ